MNISLPNFGSVNIEFLSDVLGPAKNVRGLDHG